MEECNTPAPQPAEPSDAPVSSMLPTLSEGCFYRTPEIGVYYAQEKSGLCESHQHPETQIMVTFPRASYQALYETETGAKRQRRLTGATVNIIPSGQTHGFDWQMEDRLLSIYLTPGFLARLAEEMGGANPQAMHPQWGVKNPLIQHIGEDLWREFEQDAAPSPLYIESVVTALTAHMVRRALSAPASSESAGGLSPRKLKRIQEYMQAHFQSDLTLADMAREVGLDRHHFARAFRQSVGVSPYEFVLRLRMERAVELLLTSRLTIADIARAVGFNDPGQFSRHFKRIVGVTPRERREQNF